MSESKTTAHLQQDGFLILLPSPMKVLVWPVNPQRIEEYGLSSINAQQELDRLAGSHQRKRLVFDVVPEACDLQKMVEELVEGGYHGLHLIAHGRDIPNEGFHLYLSDKNNQVDFVSSDKFLTAIKVAREHPTCHLHMVFMASCHSESLAQGLIEHGVATAIGMNDFVSVETAGKFARFFYQELAREGNVAKAHHRASLFSVLDEHYDPSIIRTHDALQDGQLYKVVDTRLFANVPPRLRGRFLGRDSLIDAVLKRFETNRLIALEGIGGVGKTTLAIEIARQYEGDVLWAGLGINPNPMLILDQWADALGMDVTEIGDLTERAKAIGNALGHRDILLIIDDVWKKEDAEVFLYSNNCKYLVTTRNNAIAQSLGAAHGRMVTVAELELEDGYRLLEVLAEKAYRTDEQLAKELVEQVGSLPLAIELLAGYLVDPNPDNLDALYFTDSRQKSLADITDYKKRLSLAQKRLGSQKNREESLNEIILLSLEGLPDEPTQAFYALSAFAPKPEKFDLAAALAVTDIPKNMFAVLLARNLVQIDEHEQMTIHRGIWDVAQTKFTDGAVGKHRNYYLTLVNEDREDWQRIEPVYGQIKWAWTQAAEDTPKNESILGFVRALPIYQKRRGLWADYLNWAKHSLKITQSQEQHSDTATILNNMGLAYDDLGKKQKALKYYNQALPIHRAVGNRAMEATTLTNIGAVYDALGKKQKALDFYNQALPIRQEVDDRSGEATTLNNIGLVYRSLGDMQQALDFYNQALPIRQEVGDRSGEATTLNNIGVVYRSLGDMQRALEYYNQALPMHREVGNRAMEVTTLTNIGVVYSDLGEKQQALDFFNQALVLNQEVGNLWSEQVIRSNIAKTYKDIGELDKAEEQMLQVVALDEEIDHPDLESDRQALAEIQAMRQQ